MRNGLMGMHPNEKRATENRRSHAALLRYVVTVANRWAVSGYQWMHKNSGSAAGTTTPKTASINVLFRIVQRQQFPCLFWKHGNLSTYPVTNTTIAKITTHATNARIEKLQSMQRSQK